MLFCILGSALCRHLPGKDTCELLLFLCDPTKFTNVKNTFENFDKYFKYIRPGQKEKLPTNLLHRGHVLVDHFMDGTQISRHKVSTQVGGKNL